jgi:hypothetical protein
MFSSGGWKVVDASRRWHRDVSLALAGAVMAAGSVAPYVPAKLWMSGDARDADVEQAQREADHADLVARIRAGGGAFFPGRDG